MRIFAVPMLICALLITGCAHEMGKSGDGVAMVGPKQASGQSDAGTPPPGVLPPGVYPASQQALPTTAGTIYLTNIDGRIDGLIAAGGGKPGNAGTPSLAEALYHRFQILGRIDDADRALALMERVEKPTATDLRERASLRSGLHRFDEALADLAQAQAQSEPHEADAKARRAIALATGDYAQIKDLIAQAEQPSPQFGELILRANIAAFKGDLAAASVQFLRAQQTINDTDPYPVAWMYAQQGLTLERFDQCQPAMVFFDAALERLPGFALALDHQAECLLRMHRLDEARKVYQQLITQTGNPEYLGGLARVEKQAGHKQLAHELETQTATAYEALLARAPKAWSEHAAEYFLAVGQNEPALRWARINLANRRDVLSLILAARAEQANGDRSRACQALGGVKASGLQPPELDFWKDELPHCDAAVALNP